MNQNTAQTIAHMFTRPHRTQMPKTPEDYGMAFESVRFPSLDGIKLSAWSIPAQKPYSDSKKSVGDYESPSVLQ